MTVIGELAALVQRETGITLKESQHGTLRAALTRISPGADPVGFLQRLRDPIGGSELLAQLIDEVTVKETFFLRDPGQLEQIPWHRLLQQARARGAEGIRVWCTGCATGEEAYTLALLAANAFAPVEAPVTILATDISRGALAAAREGSYRPRSVREIDVPTRRRYFTEIGERLVVGDQLRANVVFARHNLVADAMPPFGQQPFDLILCRNVLIYFDQPTVARVVEGLERALAPGGSLVLGAADALCGNAGRLRSLAAQVEPSRAPRRPRRSARKQDPLSAPARPRTPAGTALARDPVDEVAHFLAGLAEFEQGNVAAAVEAFRRALYLDPGFGLAAFKLGRAHDLLGNGHAARMAYERAVRTLGDVAERHEALFDQVDPADVAAAARLRLEALTSVGIGVRRAQRSEAAG